MSRAERSTAFRVAEELLADALPTRWLHVQAVHSQARVIGPALPEVDDEVLCDAAVLHDIGYAPSIAESGFHPLDGARHLVALGVSNRVVCLVARHSCALREADLRGVQGVEEFHDEQSATRDALWYCDAVTGPRGERFSPDERWAEVRQRYGPDHLVSRFLDEAEQELRAAVARTQDRMLAAGLAQSM